MHPKGSTSVFYSYVTTSHFMAKNHTYSSAHSFVGQKSRHGVTEFSAQDPTGWKRDASGARCLSLRDFRVLFQAPGGCWQNSDPCSRRTEARRIAAISWGHSQLLATAHILCHAHLQSHQGVFPHIKILSHFKSLISLPLTEIYKGLMWLGQASRDNLPILGSADWGL